MRRRRLERRLDQGAVGRPPAHVAGPLIQVAVDQFDGIERQVGQARALALRGHVAGQLFQR